MIREYIYNGKTYRSADQVRQAVYEATRLAFGEEPEEGKAEFWAQYDVTYTETPEPEPTPEEIAARELAEAKRERARQVAAITVEVDGMSFDGDETSQDRMSRTIAAAVAEGADLDTTKRVWVLADNTVAEVTVRQLAQALRLAGDAQTSVWTTPYEAKE